MPVLKSKETKKISPACCVGCIMWERHQDNCWYYWEGKKHCTMHTRDIEQLPKEDISL